MASLNPDRAPPKLVLSSLRTLNTMLDTYISPSTPLNPAAAVSSALYTPDSLRNLYKILSQDSKDRISQDQVSLTASLIAKSCGGVSHGPEEEGAAQREGLRQKLLVNAGVLDALSIRLASFAPDEYRKKCTNSSKIPPRAPPNARLAPMLDAISTIIKGSKLRSIEFLFSPTLAALFSYSTTEEFAKIACASDGAAFSINLPRLKPSSASDLIQSPRHVTIHSTFPPPPFNAGSSSSSATHFPPLSAASSYSVPPHHYPGSSIHAHAHMHNHHLHSGLTEDQRILLSGGIGEEDDSESSGEETPLRRRAVTADVDDEERLRPVPGTDSDDTDPALDIAESELINWLISLVRTGDSITRLTAASVITNLFLAGLVAKRLIQYIALLVVPILVRLLDEDVKAGGFTNTGVGGIDGQTWNRWQVEERAPAVLSRLIIENLSFQKAAIDASAVKKLAAMLKRVSDSPAVNGNAGQAGTDETLKNNPEYSHRMKVKEGVLHCLANLSLFKDEYRKKVIEAGVLNSVVSACLKPLTPIETPTPQEPTKAEGNPPPVLIAACGVIRSVSRSVSILRTSLIDAQVALPIFTLLRHENDDVKNAAAATVCNLVLDFSPMRKPIAEAGALDVLCELVKCDNEQIRLNAMWALKHLMTEADVSIKRRSIEALDAKYLLRIISNIPDAPAEDDLDEEMLDDPALDEACAPDLPPKIRTAIKQLQKQERLQQAAQARKDAVALQEQALEYLRNLLCGEGVAAMIDLIFAAVGAENLLELYENLLKTPNQKSEIVNAIVYSIVHIAAGAPKHRQKIIERTELLRVLQRFWNHHNSYVRSGLAWVVINLTWKEEGSEAEGVQRRINVLRALGWAERLRQMQKDSELDVKERVKTAEFQLSGVSGNGSSSNNGGGSSSSGGGR